MCPFKAEPGGKKVFKYTAAINNCRLSTITSAVSQYKLVITRSFASVPADIYPPLRLRNACGNNPSERTTPSAFEQPPGTIGPGSKSTQQKRAPAYRCPIGQACA